ncbi:MAG: TonB-dependent receptor [Carboxylicivirga sp.]|jgi:hypothetical protein|nr:TonB-dependent receptor [Carboxylicivirga sp.]
MRRKLKKLVLLFLAFLIFQPSVKAQAIINNSIQTQTIRGRVLDRDTKKGLPFANVIILNTYPQKGAVTNNEGYFHFEDIPVGRYTIQISFLGYEKAILPEVMVGAAKEVVLNLELSESVESMEEVVVSVKKGQALNEMATISSQSFSVEETKRYAASISDPARMAQSFAGVATSDDATNEIVIRGNSPNWMLWRLEGVEIPSPNHFAEEGYSSGAVSILSTNMLGKSDFFTGAFPSEYGSALSGVFDIKLRNGNNEKREYSAQVGLLGIELAAEGPIKKGYRGSYLVNYRYSTLSILNNLGLDISENTLPNYQDLSFKFNLPTSKAGTLSIWGIGGSSYADEKFYPDTAFNEQLEDGYSDYTTTGMYATGIGHTYLIDNKSYLKSVISHSKSYSSQTFDVMDTLGVMSEDFFDDLATSALRINSFYNRKTSKKVTFRIGAAFNKLNYNYYSKHIDESGGWKIDINGKGSTNLYQSFIQTKYTPADNLIFTAGLHYSRFALSADNSFEPRLGIEINIKSNQKIGLGFGMHSKNENLPVYFVEFKNEDGTSSYLNQNLKLTRSTHYILSYQNQFNQNWNFKTEIYYQDISRLPVPNNPDKPLSPAFNGVNPNDTLVSKGVGKNYGIEFTLQRYFNKGFYILATSSLFESKYKPLDGNWYNTRYNLNYVNNLVGGKEFNWGTNKMLSLNGKLLSTGGRRYIPIDLESSIDEGETVYNFDNVYEEQLSPYFRIDLGARIHFFKERTEHIVALDIQNLTNRLNDWYQIYNSKSEKIINYPMAGILPVLSYRIEF